jgi:Ca2+/H+ antiporter
LRRRAPQAPLFPRPSSGGCFFPEHAGEHHATQAPPAPYAAPDQEADELTLAIPAALLIFFVVVIVVFGAGFASEAGHAKAAEPSTTTHGAGADEEAEQLSVLCAFALVLVLVFYVDVSLTALADHVRDEQAAQASATRGAADQHPSQVALIVFAFVLAFVVELSALAKQVRQQHPAQPPTADHAACEDTTSQRAVLALVLVLTAFDVGIVLAAPLAEQVRQDEPAQPASTDRAATGEEPDDAVLVDPA